MNHNNRSNRTSNNTDHFTTKEDEESTFSPKINNKSRLDYKKPLFLLMYIISKARS